MVVVDVGFFDRCSRHIIRIVGSGFLDRDLYVAGNAGIANDIFLSRRAQKIGDGCGQRFDGAHGVGNVVGQCGGVALVGLHLHARLSVIAHGARAARGRPRSAFLRVLPRIADDCIAHPVLAELLLERFCVALLARGVLDALRGGGAAGVRARQRLAVRFAVNDFGALRLPLHGADGGIVAPGAVYVEPIGAILEHLGGFSALRDAFSGNDGLFVRVLRIVLGAKLVHGARQRKLACLELLEPPDRGGAVALVESGSDVNRLYWSLALTLARADVAGFDGAVVDGRALGERQVAARLEQRCLFLLVHVVRRRSGVCFEQGLVRGVSRVLPHPAAEERDHVVVGKVLRGDALAAQRRYHWGWRTAVKMFGRGVFPAAALDSAVQPLVAAGCRAREQARVEGVRW